MPVPRAISVVARVVLYGVVAAAITAAVGWMINEIHKDDEGCGSFETRQSNRETMS